MVDVVAHLNVSFRFGKEQNGQCIYMHHLFKVLKEEKVMDSWVLHGGKISEESSANNLTILAKK